MSIMLDAPPRLVLGDLVDQLFIDIVFASTFDFVARITHALPITLPLLLAWSARCHESANCSSYSYEKTAHGWRDKDDIFGASVEICSNRSDEIKDETSISTSVDLDIDHVGRSTLKSS